MKCNPHNLLRRTSFIVAAAIGIASIPAVAQSQNLTKKSDGSVLCSTWTSITQGPTGLVVDCGTTTSPPPATTAAGTFTITAANSTALAWNATSTTSFTVTRSSGTTGPVTVNFTRGGGCGPLPLQDSVSFADAQTTANLTVKTPNNDATCTFTLNSAAVGTGSTATTAPAIGSPSMAYVLVGAGAGVPASQPSAPPPGTSAFNCPPTPTDANSSFVLAYGGGVNGILLLNSGQIGYTTLPLFSSSGGPPQSGSGDMRAAISTNSPTSGTVEVSINHCKGVIDTAAQYVQGTTGGTCYKSFPIDQSQHDQYWFEQVGASPSATDATANANKICEAYASNGPWYVNVRYTFPDAGSHNMAWQWQFGYFNP